MERLKKIAAFVAAQKERVLTLGAGWSIDMGINWIIEFIIYPWAINVHGLLIGGGMMVAGCTILNLILFKIYDLTKRDWLGIEAIKSVRDEEQTGWFARTAGWLMRKGDLVALIGLSIISEPVKVTLYMRKGASRYNGFITKRDWIVFIFSSLITNASWATAVWGSLETFKFFF